jgi:uncharacterized ferritin-like protein (DUF455 family)
MSKKLTVRDNAKKLAKYRWVEGQMIELMGGWAYTVPEAEVKRKFGYWMHEDAQHSKMIKERLPELMLRHEKRQEQPPSDDFVRLGEKIWHADDTIRRLTGLGVILKRGLIAAYENHLAQVDSPPDEPTEKVIRKILEEERAHAEWCEQKLHELCDTPAKKERAEAWQKELETDLQKAGGILGNDQPMTYSFRKTFPPSKAPVRDPRWKIFDDDAQYTEKNYSFATTEGKHHLLHDLLNSEYITVERLGRILAEFPELPFEMKVDLARQAWDEARHGEVVQQLLEELGGAVGMYPINFWGWAMDVNHPDPLGRLALSNATFESESCKHVKTWIERAKATGDWRSVQVLEYILADEVTHVQFGNKWIDKLTENDPERRQRVWDYAKKCLETETRPQGIYFEETREAKGLRS